MKMIISLLFCIMAFGEGKVGNGGDISTRTLIYAADNLQRYISYCLTQDSCVLDSRQRETLEKIDSLVLQKYKLRSLLVFVENDTQNIFYENGIEKIAMTSPLPGSEIYINSKRLKSYSNYEATSLLVHELGHQVGYVSHVYLDQLGVSFSSQVRHFSKSSGLFVDPFVSGALYFENGWSGQASAVVEEQVIAIDKIIYRELACPVLSVFSPVVKKDLRILNLYQDEFSFSKGALRVIPLTVWAQIKCNYQNGGVGRYAHRVKVDLPFKLKNQSYRYDETQTKVRFSRIGK